MRHFLFASSAFRLEFFGCFLLLEDPLVNGLFEWAGLAFHPVDGILQAIPHLFALFLIPTHFRTHIVLLFFEVVWTANIHDGIHAQMWPVLGAGYHTIHHTRYRYNYGHYSIWMDWMFGTLLDPMDTEAKGL